jgi:hypothetical protein
MHEFSNSITELAKDNFFALGLIFNMNFTLYFIIRRIFVTWFKEKRKLNREDADKMLKNIGVIIIITMCMTISMILINQAHFPEQESIGYKKFAIIIFVVPVVGRSIAGKEFT